jgi:hypothetical protein
LSDQKSLNGTGKFCFAGFSVGDDGVGAHENRLSNSL